MTLSQMKYRIVIPVSKKEKDYKNIKGKQFENLISAFLKYQSYDVVERLRDVGTEIDLLCKHRFSSSSIVVECKTQSDTLQSVVVNKLFTDVDLNEADSGWIFSLSPLGSEAAGRLQKLNAKRGKDVFKYVSADELVGELISSNALSLPSGVESWAFAELYLCLVRGGRLWVAPDGGGGSGRPVGLYAWNADTGQPVQPQNCPDFAGTDFPFPELKWLDQSDADAEKEYDTQPVVEVIPGDEWSDYRPSRPDDFVGRKRLISDVKEFMERVKSGDTRSRLFGVKGASGWGKSSLALKLAKELREDGVIIFPVDCRAAKASFYPDLVVSKALNYASQDILPGPLFKLSNKFETNPFEEKSVTDLLKYAQDQGIVICIVFDQFEEIIHRTELAPVFERMKSIALSADECNSAVVIGFSWKTDGTVGSDYPGYYLWHELSDRRKDFTIDRFSREDADEFISLAQRESKQKLRKNVINFIIEHYAGFPWLLKKLVKHYIEDAKKNQGHISAFSHLSLESLFQSDLQELTDSERRVLKFIAQLSPVEFGSVSEKFGVQVIESLISRRLVINTGGQLILYWDIFRDYILYQEVPQLPNNYVPTISVRRLRSVIRIVLGRRNIRYQEIANELSVSLSTADNVVRDLANMGIVVANRGDQVFHCQYDSPVEVTSLIVDFLKNQSVYVRAEELIKEAGGAVFSEICRQSYSDYQFMSVDVRTVEVYSRKILLYCLQFGLLKKEGNYFSFSDPVENILDAVGRTARVSEVDLFRAAAPPERVVELMDHIISGVIQTREKASNSGLRNAVFAASTLGLITNKNGYLTPAKDLKQKANPNQLVRDAVLMVEPFRNCFSDIPLGQFSAEQLGVYVADLYVLNWSPGSCRRHGSAFKRWLKWLDDTKYL